MNIFVAGASGAIGPPLIAALVRQRHTVTGMSRDEAGTQQLVDMGATVAMVNAFDGAAVAQALRRSKAEVVIDQLTALPNILRDTQRHSPAIGRCGLRVAAIFIVPRRRPECVATSNRRAAFFCRRTLDLRTSLRVWQPTQALAWPRVRRCMPTWKHDCCMREQWKASPFAMGSFMVRTRGIARKAPLPTTPDGGRCQLSDRAKVSGLSCILRMRRLPLSPR